MAYTPTTWVNGTTPALNATNLNKIETGIDEAHDDIATLNAALVTDLISGVTPTLVGWTTDPTNAANITDGDISTFCDTGNWIAPGGFQLAHFEWDLGQFENVLVTGVGTGTATAGAPYLFAKFWDGVAWIAAKDALNTSATMQSFVSTGAQCSKVRLGLTGTVAATLTPDIRGFHVWRL